MKKILLIIIGLIVVVGVVFAMLVILLNNQQVIGGDKDSHGCLAAAGYQWCEQKQKCLRVFEEFCTSEADKLVSDIKVNTGIDLLPAGDVTFTWNVMEGSNFVGGSIDGVKYTVENIKQADYQKVENYMKNNYEQNIGNQADGVVGGERGYIVNYMACALNFIHTEMIDNPGTPSVPGSDILNVSLSCGYFNKNDIPKILENK